jgi:hypothetical protein
MLGGMPENLNLKSFTVEKPLICLFLSVRIGLLMVLLHLIGNPIEVLKAILLQVFRTGTLE